MGIFDYFSSRARRERKARKIRDRSLEAIRARALADFNETSPYRLAVERDPLHGLQFPEPGGLSAYTPSAPACAPAASDAGPASCGDGGGGGDSGGGGGD